MVTPAVRVGVPPPLDRAWASGFRSAERVWSNIQAHLATPAVQVVESDPDVWLWDVYRKLPDDDAPMVAVVHEVPSAEHGLDPRLFDHLDGLGRRVAARAERIVTCSQASRDEISERYDFPADRIDVVMYGVDRGVFEPEGPTAESAIAAAGGDDRPYVLFVGTVIPRKNLPLLREAMARLPSHQLVVVASAGLDPRWPELLEQAIAPLAGRPVPNLAGVDDAGLAALMRGADALCLPSLSEGFGLPVAEAMACGTPVVVSDRGSLPEVVGDAGVVVAPEVDALLGGLREAIANRAELSRRARRRAVVFDWARTAAAIRAITLDVAGGAHG